MKKLFLIVLLAIAVQSASFAQQWTTSGNSIINTNSGPVIVKNPSTATDNYTSLRLQGPNFASGLEIDFFGNTNNQGGAWTYYAGNGGVGIVNINNAPMVLGTNNVGRIFIAANGNVGIGTAGTTTAALNNTKLAVEGLIGARSIKVLAPGTAWPDFVFLKTHRLRPLSEVESYIQANQHLPEVPSAADVAKDGINLGEMDATLLKKIEELTLYMIEQNKRIQALEKQLSEAKK